MLRELIKMQMPSIAPDLQNYNSFILFIESIFIERLQLPSTILGAEDRATKRTNLPVSMELTYRCRKNAQGSKGE